MNLYEGVVDGIEVGQFGPYHHIFDLEAKKCGYQQNYIKPHG
jgi:hypothetical protein